MLKDISGRQVNLEIDGGSGPVVVLLHGWGGSINSLQGIYEKLRPVSNCVILDLPGFGHSTKPDTAWGIDDYATFLKNLFESLNLKHVVLFGHSFGGALSLYMAYKYPSLVQSLVVCAPSYKRNIQNTKKKNLSNLIPFYAGIKKYLYLPRKIAYKLLFPDSDLFKAPHMQETFEKIVKEDLTPLVSNIKVPTLILWGDQDRDVPIEYAYLLDELLESSRLVVFENEGHGFPLHKTEAVVDEVLRFWGEK